MIDVATSRWYDLIVTMMKNHDQSIDESDYSVNDLLDEYYGARYKFASPRHHFIYSIEFNDPHKETLFKLKYSEYL